MIYFLFGKFLIYPDNKYNNIFFDLYGEYCPQSSHQPRKFGGYLELGQYFLKQNQKTVITTLFLTRSSHHSQA